MIFAKEEVHVVELDRISAVLCDQVAENCCGAFRRFHTLFVAVGGMDPAEAAVEGASDAGVMDCSAFAEEGRPEIFFDGHPMEGMTGELVRPLARALVVVSWDANDIFIGNSQ